MTQGRIPDFSRYLPALQDQGEALAVNVQDALKARAPVYGGPEPSRTPGTFRDSLVSTVRPTPNGLQVVVDSDDEPVKQFILNGTRPHTIVPRTAKALRFVAGGEVVYTKRVAHPGTAPNDFVGQSYDQLMSLALEAHERALQAALS